MKIQPQWVVTPGKQTKQQTSTHLHLTLSCRIAEVYNSELDCASVVSQLILKRGMTLIENRLFSSFEVTTEFSFNSTGLKLLIRKLYVLRSLRMHFRLSVQHTVPRILLSPLHLQFQRYTSSRQQLDKERFPGGCSFSTA